MEASSLISSLISLLGLIPQFVILVASIYYNSKNKSTAGILMISGSALNTLLAIYYRLVIPLMAYSSGMYSLSSQMIIYNILGIIGFAGGVLFAVGFFMAIIKFVKAKAGQ